MNEGLKTFLTFVLGAAAGSVVTWYFVKNKYEQIAAEEIEEIREYYRNIGDTEGPEDGDTEEEETAFEESLEEEDIQSDRVATAAEYVRENTPSIQEVAASKLTDTSMEGDDTMDEPYVIAPEQCGDLEDEGYIVETLTYYSDGVLADEWDNVIENADDLVGDDFASHFGEYEDDAVYVRNDVTRTDYEILRDNRPSTSVLG